MRILLLDHLPLESAQGGEETARLARGLRRLAHEVACLVADERPSGDDEEEEEEEIPVHRVLFRRDDPAADVPFALPAFSADSPGGPTFLDLTDRQIADYREAMRRHLDREVNARDPQIIHAQYVWLLGHLALETGVPYVLSARGAELQAYRQDRRWRRFADEAAAGAGKILAADEHIGRELRELFPHASERIALLVPADGTHGQWIAGIAAIYEAVLRERFGS
jgi:hypothetical protein